MARQSKRQRKFHASGGVKKRLEKGTITKKGKLKKRKRTDDDDKVKPREEADLSTKGRDRSDDFTSSNLAGLELDDFFAQVSEAIEEKDDDDEDALMEEEQGNEISDDDEEEEKPQKKKDANNNKKQQKKKQQQPKEEENSESEDSGSDSDDDIEEEAATKENKTKPAKPSSSSSSDDDDDNSDDEDVEAAEQRMKDQMAKLTKSDPEFHDFLQENESSLLEFGDEEGMQEESDDEEESKRGAPSIHLTLPELKKLQTGVFEAHGMKHLKKLMAAYRSACHLADSVEDKKSRPGESGIHFAIDSSAVFDKLMVLCLKQLHEVFHLFLFQESKKKAKDDQKEDKDEKDDEDEGIDVNKPIDPRKMERSERWSDMQKILKSFFTSTLHIMSEAKEPELLTFILKALSNYIPLVSPFPRVAEAMLKCFVDKWSAPLDVSEDYQVVRLNAFFRIRQLAKTQPFPFIETCLRKTYLAYARRAKHGKSAPTVEVLSTLTFMGNSVVELYSLDLHSSYQHAFVYIRQLALHLRAAIQKTTPESIAQLFRWQYMHCLKLWVAVLSDLVSAEDGAQMRSLIYPLSEVINGVARLAPANVRHLPFRFHCVRLLQQLAAASETFMPTTSLLLECLDWKEWYMKPKKTGKKNTTAGLDFLHILKLPKEDSLRTHEQLEAGITEFFVLLEREVDLYIYTPGFPEYSMWIRRRLKAFNRETRQQRWRRFSEGIIDACEKHSKAAVIKRAKLDEAPRDVNQLECLRPMSTPTMKERHKLAMEKEAKRLVATGPSSAKPAGKKKQQQDEDESGNESGNESDEQSPQTKKAKKARKDKAKKISKKADGYDDPEVLDQQDDVQEGINWSDGEDD
uniref:Nucleolar complex protein 2 homolog n=1 Tax=Entomoneis paludosa TaxID=265537 RepID=A0A7S2VGJ3_9STRA|mmetsp:Transcript_17730/g.36711  ORF Transcript_17730/g.36711 Transcript_17730/m.36711 type:complete len:856 (+) Transcript_17730:14-2581(+)